MRTTLLLLGIAGLGLAESTPLTEIERLKIENASLRIQAAEAQKQALDAQKQEAQKAAQAVFEAACTRAKIDLAACQFDSATASVKKAPDAPKAEVKK